MDEKEKTIGQWLEEAEEVSDYKGKKEVVCQKCYLTSCDCE